VLYATARDLGNSVVSRARSLRFLPVTQTTNPPQGAPPPPPNAQQSSDDKEKGRKWTEVLLGPVLGFVGGILVVLIPIWWPDDKPHDPVEISITNKKELEKTHSHQVPVSGEVKNLKPGQTVWVFDAPVEDPWVYAHDGPCPVDDNGKFDCGLIFIGDPEADKGKQFTIFTAVLEETDIREEFLLWRDREDGKYGHMGRKDQPPGVKYDTATTTREPK
jgi:hypothetical protein